jgi:HD-GYP domain-containing protein (c-di-GMP phosphodiesterase class II)
LLDNGLAPGDPVARRMQALRREISHRALSRTLPPERRSILADVVTKRTVDRVVEWASLRDPVVLFNWVDSVLREYPQETRLYNLLPSTVSAALDVLSEKMTLPAEFRTGLTDLQQRIDVHIGAFCTNRQEHDLRAVDPVDAKIDELLFKLSAQDSLTAEHSRSVGMWCWRIAKHLKLPRTESYLVTRSGLLHDVGKTTTPVEILTAARKLDEQEWKIMRAHAASGEHIVGKVSELRLFAPAVRSHHERFDGKGYPDGLERAFIPFAARVVAVADAFNAMIARRPYRAPLPPTHAIEELKRNSGTQFDPAAVQAMIDVVLSGR